MRTSIRLILIRSISEGTCGHAPDNTLILKSVAPTRQSGLRSFCVTRGVTSALGSSLRTRLCRSPFGRKQDPAQPANLLQHPPSLLAFGPTAGLLTRRLIICRCDSPSVRSRCNASLASLPASFVASGTSGRPSNPSRMRRFPLIIATICRE